MQAFAQGQLPLYENRHGYRAPFRVYGGGSLGTTWLGALTTSAGLEAFHEAAEKWDGEIRQDGNLGRTELLAAVTFGYDFGATALSLAARFPLWRDVVTGDEPAGTLSAPVTASVSVSHVIGAGRERTD